MEKGFKFGGTKESRGEEKNENRYFSPKNVIFQTVTEFDPDQILIWVLRHRIKKAGNVHKWIIRMLNNVLICHSVTRICSNTRHWISMKKKFIESIAPS